MRKDRTSGKHYSCVTFLKADGQHVGGGETEETGGERDRENRVRYGEKNRLTSSPFFRVEDSEFVWRGVFSVD